MDIGPAPAQKKRGRPRKAIPRFGFKPQPESPPEAAKLPPENQWRDLILAMEAAWKPRSDQTIMTIHETRSELGALRRDYTTFRESIVKALQEVGKSIESRVGHHIDESARVTDRQLQSLQAMMANVLEVATRPNWKKEAKKAKKKAKREAME